MSEQHSNTDSASIGDSMLILGLRLQLHTALVNDDRERIKTLNEQIAALEKAVGHG